MPKFDPKDIEDHRIIAAFSYIGILFLVPLLGARGSRYAQEHAKQGMLLFVIWVIGAFFFWIPFLGWMLFAAVILANVLVILKCLQGIFWEIPILGPYRGKIKL